MRDIYIVRHGETEWNLAGRMQGRLDSPLTENGKAHAVNNGKLLKSLGGVEQLCVSPSGRTTETAFIINSIVQSHIEYFEELMERDCGDWSAMTVDEITSTFPDEWRSREDDPYWFSPPGGECMNDMLLRVHQLLEDLYVSDFESVALVTHGVMSKVILKYYLELGELEAARLRHPNNLVYRLTFTPKEIETHYYIDGGQAQAGLLREEVATVLSE